jgi:hypothetical protein
LPAETAQWLDPQARQLKALLAAGPSAPLRDQLIAEIQNCKEPDELALWAHRRLPAKNTLTADDARAVEAAYQEVLRRSDEQPLDVSPALPDVSGETLPEVSRVSDQTNKAPTL